MIKSKLFPGILIAAGFLVAGLLTHHQYGFFWDYFFHLNAGLKRLGITPANPTDLDDQPYGIFASLPGAASYTISRQNTPIVSIFSNSPY